MGCGATRAEEVRDTEDTDHLFYLPLSVALFLFLYPKVDSLRVRKTQVFSFIFLSFFLSLQLSFFFIYPVVDSSPSRCNIRLIELTLSLDAIKAGRSS